MSESKLFKNRDLSIRNQSQFASIVILKNIIEY